METLQELNTPSPVAVLSCKIPLELKGRFIGKAAENKLLPAAQLAILVDQFTKSKDANWMNDTEREKLTAEIAKLKKEVEEGKKESAKKASNLTANESKLNARIKALENECAQLKADKTKLNSEILSSSKSKSSTEVKLNADIKKLSEEIAEHKKKMQKLETDLQNEKKKYAEFHAQVLKFRNLVIEKHNRSVLGFGNEVVEAAENIK